MQFYFVELFALFAFVQAAAVPEAAPEAEAAAELEARQFPGQPCPTSQFGAYRCGFAARGIVSLLPLFWVSVCI